MNNRVEEVINQIVTFANNRLDESEENGTNTDMSYWAAYLDGVMACKRKIDALDTTEIAPSDKVYYATSNGVKEMEVFSITKTTDGTNILAVCPYEYPDACSDKCACSITKCCVRCDIRNMDKNNLFVTYEEAENAFDEILNNERACFEDD